MDPSVRELKDAMAALLRQLAKFPLQQGDGISPAQKELLGAITADAEALSGRVATLARNAAPPALSHKPAPTRGSLPAANPDRFTVLVVDDDPQIREILESLLEPQFDVLVSEDGTHAEQILRLRQPDVVLADLCMPNMDGITLMESMHRSDPAAQIPFVVLSAMGDTKAKIRAFEAGAFDYITKPVVSEELIARIRNALGRSQALRRERILQSTDDLTGLSNRRAMREFLDHALKIAARDRSDLSVVMLDMDGLKQINDQFGHACGDEALRVIARALMASTRGTDCGARLGGDEFLAAMPSMNRVQAGSFIVRVEDELRLHPISLPNGQQITIGASFGAASLGDVAWSESADQLLERADLALYEIKRGRQSLRQTGPQRISVETQPSLPRPV